MPVPRPSLLESLPLHAVVQKFDFSSFTEGFEDWLQSSNSESWVEYPTDACEKETYVERDFALALDIVQQVVNDG